jgi:RimJ/RimL family protein N-acetyltransferase
LTWPAPLTAQLQGALVVLEPLRADHRDQLFAASQDLEVWRWTLGTMPDADGFDAWLQYSLAEAAAGRAGAFATLDRPSGRAVGSSRYLTLRPEHRSVEIGWTWLARSQWRTGANVEAKLLMLDYAFARLGCQRVEFKTDARNERSRAALAALPAQFEGIFRRHMVMPYGTRDSAYYSVIADEWPDVRDNLRARLARGSGA